MLAVAVPSWAQITFGSWGRVVITPISLTYSHQLNKAGERELYSAVSAATSTWQDAPSLGFSANGKAPSGNIGFNIDFDFGYDPAKTGDIKYNIVGNNAKIWVYPLGMAIPAQKDLIKLVAGRFEEDELRGKVGATEFGSWLLPSGSKDEDNIFRRFKASAGAYARVEPLKWLDSRWNGLTLHAAFGSNELGATGNALRAPLNLYNNEANLTNGVDSAWVGWSENHGEDRRTNAADVYKAGQYAIGYRIPDIGLARFQFIGSNIQKYRMTSLGTSNAHQQVDALKRLVIGVDRGDNGDTLEFGFLYDGYKGLRVDAGFKLPLAYETNRNFEVIPSIFDPIIAKRALAGYSNGIKDDTYIVQQAMVVALGANWTPAFLSEKLNLLARFDCSFGGKTEVKEVGTNGLIYYEYAPVYSAWLVPSYKVLPFLSVGLDLGMDIHTGDTAFFQGKKQPSWTKVSTYNDFGVSPWIDLQIGGGRARIGVVVMLPGSLRDKSDGYTGFVTPKFLGDPVISVPISVTYSF